MEKLFRIDTILADRNINFYQLQKDAGIRYEIIKRLCDNTGTCNIATLVKIADYLNVSIKDLFYQEEVYDKKKYFKLGYNQAIKDLQGLQKKL